MFGLNAASTANLLPERPLNAKELREHSLAAIKKLEDRIEATNSEIRKVEQKMHGKQGRQKAARIALLEKKKELNKLRDDAKQQLSDLKTLLASADEDLAFENALDQQGLFGPSLLGRATSALVQTLAIPVTLGMRFAANHPVLAAGVVLGLQLYGAVAAPVTDGTRMNATREALAENQVSTEQAAASFTPEVKIEKESVGENLVQVEKTRCAYVDQDGKPKEANFYQFPNMPMNIGNTQATCSMFLANTEDAEFCTAEAVNQCSEMLTSSLAAAKESRLEDCQSAKEFIEAKPELEQAEDIRLQYIRKMQGVCSPNYRATTRSSHTKPTPSPIVFPETTRTTTPVPQPNKNDDEL